MVDTIYSVTTEVEYVPEVAPEVAGDGAVLEAGATPELTAVAAPGVTFGVVLTAVVPAGTLSVLDGTEEPPLTFLLVFTFAFAFPLAAVVEEFTVVVVAAAALAPAAISACLVELLIDPAAVALETAATGVATVGLFVPPRTPRPQSKPKVSNPNPKSPTKPQTHLGQ